MAKSRVRFSVLARALPRGRVASSEVEGVGLGFLLLEPDAEEEEAAERFVDAFEDEPAMLGMRSWWMVLEMVREMAAAMLGGGKVEKSWCEKKVVVMHETNFRKSRKFGFLGPFRSI